MDVFVSDDVKERNPIFSKLFDEIKLQCESSFFAKGSRYWLSKCEWLESSVVFFTVRLILHEMEYKILNNEFSDHQAKCWKSVMQAFYHSQCPTSLFQDSFLSTTASSDFEAQLPEGKQLLSSALESRLEEMALNLTDARDGLDAHDSDKIRLARALQIGTILKSDRAALENNQKKLRELQYKTVALQHKYHQGLQECSDILSKILTKYRIRLQPVKDVAIVKNAITSCDTLAAKLKSIRYELNCETYNPKSLPALTALRSEIVETTKRREMELCDVEEQLDIYRRLGSDFEAVAAKYNDVRNDLEKQQWALNEIKKKLSKS